MLRKFVLFVFLLLPCICWADNESVGVDAETNIDTIHESIKINEAEFDSLVEQVKERYPDFDWDTFDNLSSDVKRMVIRNYLAQMAYAEIAENFKTDIESRAKGGVVTEDYDGHTYYYNKSDDLYRKGYDVIENIMKEARKRGLLHKTEGTKWSHFKQKDVATLDKIIADQISKAPADMHCDKECVIPSSRVDQEWAQEYLAKWKEKIDEYEKIRRDALKEYEQYLASTKERVAEMKEKDNAKASELKKQLKVDQQKLKHDEQEFAKEMIKMRKDYDDYAKRVHEINIWMLEPYNENCEMVSFLCFNVQQIPSDHERYRLSMSKEDNDYGNISYSYDDIDKQEHVEIMALKNCNCDINNKNLTTYVNCVCSIGFYDTVTDFDKYRQYENLDRVDIKNGKIQDRDEKGHYKHDWPGNHIPVGYVKGRSTNFSGAYSITEEENEK